MRREAEQGAKEQIAAARRETAEKHDAEADARIEKLTRTFAEREAELAGELEEAAKALRSAEHRLREAEERAEFAERKLGEASAVGIELPEIPQREAEEPPKAATAVETEEAETDVQAARRAGAASPRVPEWAVLETATED